MHSVSLAQPSTSIRPFTPDPVTPGPASLRRSAEALETAFLAEMLKSAGFGTEASTGEAEQPFGSFMADAYAEALMARGGMGLASHIERSLAMRQTEYGQ